MSSAFQYLQRSHLKIQNGLKHFLLCLNFSCSRVEELGLALIVLLLVYFFRTFLVVLNVIIFVPTITVVVSFLSIVLLNKVFVYCCCWK